MADGRGACWRATQSGTLRHVAPDIQHQQRGQRTHHEQSAPADQRVDQVERQRCEEITAGIAGLQQARDPASPFWRYGFHGQRTADTPLAAHGDAEQRSLNEESQQGRGQARQKFENGITQHADHQHRPAAEMVGEPAEDDSAKRAHRQRQGDRDRDSGDGHAKFLGDIAEHEDHQEEVESIQHPAQEAGNHHLTRPIVVAHSFPPGAGIAAVRPVG